VDAGLRPNYGHRALLLSISFDARAGTGSLD
jgi:hypothetical protein